MGILEKNITLRQLFLQKTNPRLLLILFLDWNKTNLEKTQPTDFQNHQKFETLIVSCSPLHFFVSPTFGKWKNKIEKWVWMNSLFSIVHYEKLHTQILNVLRKIAKKNTAYISFSIYLSLKSPPTLIRIYGLSMCFSFKIVSRILIGRNFVQFLSKSNS